jgi:hypothetical protein
MAIDVVGVPLRFLDGCRTNRVIGIDNPPPRITLMSTRSNGEKHQGGRRPPRGSALTTEAELALDHFVEGFAWKMPVRLELRNADFGLDVKKPL